MLYIYFAYIVYTNVLADYALVKKFFYSYVCDQIFTILSAVKERIDSFSHINWLYFSKKSYFTFIYVINFSKLLSPVKESIDNFSHINWLYFSKKSYFTFIFVINLSKLLSPVKESIDNFSHINVDVTVYTDCGRMIQWI